MTKRKNKKKKEARKNMAKKISVYLHEENIGKLSQYHNKSKIINHALNLYLQNKTHYKKQKIILEQKIREQRFQLKQEEAKLRECESQIRKIEERERERPEKYNESVQILKNIKDVTQDDINYQAKRLNIHPYEYKAWLMDDGYYDLLLSHKM